MELLLQDGDYVSDGMGGFRRVEGNSEILQRVLWKLTVRRGSFPFLPTLGSRLHLLLREKPAARVALARQYVAEALADETELEVTDATLTETPERGALRVFLNRRGETLSVAVQIRGDAG